MLAKCMSHLAPVLIAAALSVQGGGAQALEGDQFCFRRCAQAVAQDLRSCRSESRRCLQTNAGAPLNASDYCLDAFLGACERSAKGEYETCLQDKCGANTATLRSDLLFEGEAPATASCSQDDSTIVDALLTGIEDLVDDDWQTVACNEGLCPLTPVYDGEIKIGCSANAGLDVALNAYCAGAMGGIGACERAST